MALPPPKRGEMGHFTGFLDRWNYPQSSGTRSSWPALESWMFTWVDDIRELYRLNAARMNSMIKFFVLDVLLT
jgi:hypothetical protein